MGIQSLYDRFIDQGLIESGWCQDFSAFMSLWEGAFQEGKVKQVRLLARNFNSLEREDGGSTLLVGLEINDLVISRKEYYTDEIYFWHPDVKKLSPEVYQVLTKGVLPGRGVVTVRYLIQHGAEIARILGCKLVVTWQQGGDPDFADYTDYVYRNGFISRLLGALKKKINRS